MPVPVSADTADPRRARLEACFLAGDYGVAGPLAAALLDEARAAGHDRQCAELAILLAKVLANDGRHAQAQSVAEEAAEAADRLDDADLQAMAWGLAAAERARCDHPRLAMQAVSRVLMTLGRLGEASTLVTAWSGLAFTYQALGLPMQALQAARQALALADAGGPALAEPRSRLRLVLNLVSCGLDAWDLMEGADPAGAERLLQDLRGHCAWMGPVTLDLQRRGERGRAGYCAAAAGVHRRGGDPASALAVLESFLTPEWRAGAPDLRADLWLELALAQRDCGQHAAVAASVAQAVAAVEELQRQPWVAELPRQAAIEELSGRPESALVLLRRHQRRLHGHVLAALEARVDELSSALTAQALRLENAELRTRAEGLADSVRQASQLAATDALTGLINRRALSSAFETMAATPGPMALAMIDLDHFKSINDRHSHLVGDAVLHAAAQCMAGALRPPDRLGRFGGEEFTALLSGLELEAAHTLLERLRERLQAHDWARIAPGLRVTLSAGLTRVLPGETFAEAAARADALLYRAKAEGRNRVVPDGLAAG